MKTREYTIRFLTPAFLGNAEQNGQWRIPPFKALLRQWWRVAYAAKKQFKMDQASMAAMRYEEGSLFGHAWLENDQDEKGNKVAARKSQVRIRLDDQHGQAWSQGTQQGVEPLPTGLDTSYAWFGLVNRKDKDKNKLPDRTGIKPTAAEGVRTLRIALPDEQTSVLEEVLVLINALGLLGSRSRGGWGALQIDGVQGLSGEKSKKYARSLDACLKDDWAMSLAIDEKGLCLWEGKKEFDSWDEAMKFIATQRKQVRANLKQMKDLRPALGFASPGRMPSPLRWKVMATQPGKLRVRVFALPHRIPDEGGKRLSPQDLQSAWKTVASTLDNSHQFLDRTQ